MIKDTRIQAVDVMRGMTMAWMIVVNNQYGGNAFNPLCHAQWNGLTPTDLAYPFFMFIMGVSMCFSLRKYEDKRKDALGKIFRRGMALVLIGMFVGSFHSIMRGSFSFDYLRILGVLQRLGIVYLLGSLLYLYVPKKWQIPLSGLILAVYVILLQFGNGYVHSAENLCARIDTLLLGPGHMISERAGETSFAFEPEGIISTIPCLAHVLLGAYVGMVLVGTSDNSEKIRRIAVFGATILFLGYLLSYLDPINKKLWTASFVLVTCGAASLFLALLVDVIDINGKGRALAFFKVFGTNAILAYILSSLLPSLPWLLGLGSFGAAVYGMFSPLFGPEWASFLYSSIVVLIVWIIVFPLYKKKIFVRV